MVGVVTKSTYYDYTNDRVNSSDAVEVKTPTNTEENKIPSAVFNGGTNVLHSHRSYTYIFTLAALNRSYISNHNAYKDSERYYVIARSGGKGTSGLYRQTSTFPATSTVDAIIPGVENLKTPYNTNDYLQDSIVQGNNKDISKTDLVNSFNKNSSGQFDFYIGNVTIESIVGGNPKTSMCPATNIEFVVTEPYSMNGFIEALQVASIACGNDSYVNGAFLLKMEFIGYPDDNELSDAVIIPNSTRYFPFVIHNIDINVDESGAHYTCSAVPYNERALGEAGTLQDEMKLVGSTVGEILETFENNLNTSAEKIAEAVNGDGKNHDIYEIIIPTRNNDGTIDDSKVNTNIANAQVTHLLKSAAAYQFTNLESLQNKNKEEYVDYRSDPSNPVASFPKGQTILDCIISVVRDSEYLPNIIKDNNNKIDANGFIDYFMVNVETEDLGVYDNKGIRPFFKYRYIVVPYKIHYTRIQPRLPNKVDTSKIETLINRQYQYLYTGKNVDIKNFQLKFNNLYYQALPLLLGNKLTLPFNNTSIEGDNPTIANLVANSSGIDFSKRYIPPAPIKAFVDFSTIYTAGQPNAKKASIDPYYELAKAVHQGILINVDQVTANVEIIGDPYYLITDNMGNQRHTLNPDGTVGAGEAPYILGDVHILLEFRSPFDINSPTGDLEFQTVAEADYDKKILTKTEITKYSGVFRVITLTSSFKDGEFTQSLELVRIPDQIDNSEQTLLPPQSAVSSNPDPTRQNTPIPANKPAAIRASSNDLAISIANGAPITGLPGDQSNFLPGAANSLAGQQPVGNVLNLSQVAPTVNGSGALTNRLSGLPSTGLNSVLSAVRLANAGLLDLTGTISYPVSGAVNQISSLANSIGLKAASAQKVARLMSALGAKQPAQLLSNVVSKVSNLESKAAGLISNVSSKIYQLDGKILSLERQLGMVSNVVSGLEGSLQNNLLGKVQSLINKTPASLDVNAAIQKGILMNSIPASSYPNLPPTQPSEIAPEPSINMSDIQNNIDRLSKLDNFAGQLTAPDILGSLPPGMVNSQDVPALADKLSTIQYGMNNLVDSSPSVESSLNNISNITGANVPNTGDPSTSVVNQFGSNSETATSPLAALMKSRLI